MPALNCSVRDCAYNSENKCCYGRIQVEGGDVRDSGDTCCGSYADKGGCGCQNAVPSLDTPVGCNVVSCRFNENMDCSAHHISIEGDNCRCKTDTCCASFEAR